VRLRVTVIGCAQSCSFITACCILVGCPTGHDDQGDINNTSIPLNFQVVLLSVLDPQMHPSNYPKRSLSQASTTSTSSRTSQHSQKKQDKSFSLSSKIFRSKSPAPIDIPKSRSFQDSNISQAQDIPRSNPEPSYFPDHQYHSTSPREMSPTISSPQSPKPDFATKQGATSVRKDYRRYTGTVNHYGRHSNDWLFGGFSVRETVREGIEKLRGSDKDS
jgi:hypothetical protein